MPLAQQDYEAIGEYVRQNLGEWLQAQSLSNPPHVYEIELRERIVRVEEELKHQRELIQQGFSLMEKRFEQVDKRFEQVDKRFEQVDKRFEEMLHYMDKRFESVEKRLISLETSLRRFIYSSFSFTAAAAGVIIAVMKLT